MKVASRIVVGVLCIIVLLIGWFVVVNAKSEEEKQNELVDEAVALMDQNILIRAQPLLEEAIAYDGPRSGEAEELLKKIYVTFLDERGYRRKYLALLEEEMGRKEPEPTVFIEAGNYYLDASKLTQAIITFKNGYEQTGDMELKDLYESNRYAYHSNYLRHYYDDVTVFYNGAIQVCLDGKWGLANTDGSILIDCQYDKISTYYNNTAIVCQNGEIFTVDSSGHRLYVAPVPVDDFINLASDRTALLAEEGWIRANSILTIGNAVYEELCMAEGGYAAAKCNGKWGVINLQGEWVVPAEYEGVVRNELGGCCYVNGAGEESSLLVFVNRDGNTFLLKDNQQLPQAYEDARPFAGGYAAVKMHGKWGFIDADGIIQIPCTYEDALSFDSQVAAVRIDGLWGYISCDGEMVIEAQFEQAKSFQNGIAPVLLDNGWTFISLYEYE